MRRKRCFKQILILGLMMTLFGLTSCHTKEGLEKQITQALENKYGTEFSCESLSINGGGATFVCYPSDDPSLLFDGLADSKTGEIGYDHFTGALFAKEDSRIMTELLSDKLGEVYIYGTPEHSGGSYVESIIRRGNYNLEDLKGGLLSPNLFFYIFIDTSSELFIDDPGRDYDVLNDVVNKLVEHYKNVYEHDICVDMHIYYVDDKDLAFAKEYFQTHVTVYFDFNTQIGHKKMIALQMGPEDNGEYFGSLRLTRDEYIEERERMGQV